MRAGGRGWTDADRAPGSCSLSTRSRRRADRREHLVIACSALRQRYRDVLRGTLRTSGSST
jgi:gluconate kinase